MIHYLFMICLCILSSCSTAVNTSSEPVQPKDREVHDTTNFNVDEIGQDNSALLNNTEGEFFNLFFKNRLNGFNFINKRVLFLQGIDGSHIVDKQTIFANGLKKSIKENVEKVEFSNKELILTQDIVDGYWKINPQTNLLIGKEKTVYEKIEKIVKEKNLDKEEIKVTLLVLYYLNTDSSINKIEYSLIIKKGVNFLEQKGINFDELLPMIKS